MIDTLTLSDFLLARIAEERLFWETVGEARQAHPDRVRRYLAKCDAERRVVEMGGSTCSDYGDPVNAEIAASIGVPEWLHYPDPDWTGHCDGCSAAEAADNDHTRVIGTLASVYADHPDYREEWRP